VKRPSVLVEQTPRFTEAPLHHEPFRAQRSLAEAERGLELRSAAVGRMISGAISEYDPTRKPASKDFFTRGLPRNGKSESRRARRD